MICLTDRFVVPAEHRVTYDVVVFAALGWERRAVTDSLRALEPVRSHAWSGRTAEGARCLVVQTGVGPERAGRAVAAAPDAKLFLACGCGGGLAPWLRAGDIVVADAVYDNGQTAHAGTSGFGEWAARRGLRVHRGSVLSSPSVLATAAAKAAAARDGAIIVDMESGPIAAAAAARSIPFAALRVVVDAADEAVPFAPDVFDEYGEMRPARIAMRLAARPWLWPLVARLARRSRIAERRLRVVAGALFGPGGGEALYGRPIASVVEA